MAVEPVRKWPLAVPAVLGEGVRAPYAATAPRRWAHQSETRRMKRGEGRRMKRGEGRRMKRGEGRKGLTRGLEGEDQPSAPGVLYSTAGPSRRSRRAARTWAALRTGTEVG